jgi:CRP/FNR family transcriptional regulator, cyclic AMP receptor protein
MGRETLAEIVGTTVSRVSVFRNRFRKLGCIGYDGGLTIHSSLLNIVLQDQQRVASGLLRPLRPGLPHC